MNLFIISTTLFCCLFLSCQNYRAQESQEIIDYRKEMRDLVIEVSKRAKAENPNFVVIPQNGVELLVEKPENLETPAINYLNAIDAVAQEDFFFGNPEINDATPNPDNLYLSTFLHLAKNKGKKVLVTDYCSSPNLINTSYKLNEENNFTSFAAPSRDLNQIPNYPVYKENKSDITTLSEAQNFLYLLNFSEYPSKQDLIAELNFTNYDLIVLDLFFEDKAFTKEEIRQLKQKKNGGSRLVIAYMSIGEAEDYRFYWKDSWGLKYPEWIVEENPDWEGNFKVKYWNEDWKKIIYAGKNAYLSQILDSDFDGVYLDIIDGFQYFEENF